MTLIRLLILHIYTIRVKCVRVCGESYSGKIYRKYISAITRIFVFCGALWNPTTAKNEG